jgi:hypothetical protein
MICITNKSLTKTDLPLNVQVSLLMALAAETHLAEGHLRRFKSTRNSLKALKFRFCTLIITCLAAVVWTVSELTKWQLCNNSGASWKFRNVRMCSVIIIISLPVQTAMSLQNSQHICLLTAHCRHQVSRYTECGLTEQNTSKYCVSSFFYNDFHLVQFFRILWNCRLN